MDWTPLHTVLRKLAAAGNDGFEGFIASSLTEITGRTFRVVKSGPQGGFDGLNEPGASGLHVGFEGKRYGEETKLALGALKTKVEEAVASMPDLDLWILATTRSVDAGDRAKLTHHGHVRGIEVLILDWAPASGLPPLLALICAMAPQVFGARFARSTKARAVVSDLRQSDLFSALSSELREQLTSPSVGYAAAKSELSRWTTEQLTSVVAAQLAFDSYANLRDPAAGSVIVRRSLSAALDKWWTSSTFAAVVIGAEGLGKTWGALSWWLAASHDETFPLTVVIPARRISTDGPTSVSEALQRAVDRHGPDFWLRRLKRWVSSSAPGKKLLVVVDGLNQYWQFTEWSNWLRSFQVAPWKGRVRVLLTCRPDHWHQELRELPGLATSIVSIPVTGFSDEELDELLATQGVTRTDFHPTLLDLMRVPRLSQIALALRGQLKDKGDITRERLLYEDWRHRSDAALSKMTDVEFRIFLGKLAGQLQADKPAVPLKRRELLDRLGEDSGDDHQALKGVMSDIVDGRWLESTGNPHEFRLDRNVLPHALALSLIYELRDVSSPKDIKEHLAARMEPYQAQDDALRILRSAASIALFDAKVSQPVRCELFLRWLRSQNFSGVDFDDFWRVLGSDISSAMEVIDHLWFKDHGHRADEVIVKALVNASRWPDVFSAIEQQLTEWFRRYWLDPIDGEVSGPIADDVRAEARRTNTRRRAELWSSEKTAAGFGFGLLEVPATGQAWGGARAAALVSWLPRAPLIRPITAWVVTHAAMESGRQRDALHWALRWNRHDPEAAEETVKETARLLAATSNEVGIFAARTLLEGLGSADAMTLAAELPSPSLPERSTCLETVRLGTDGAVIWDYAAASAWPRCLKAPLDATMGLSAHAINPDARLSPEALGALVGISSTISDAMLRGEEPGATHENGGLDTAALSLSRWAPELRAELEARSYPAPTLTAPGGSSASKRRGKPRPAPRFLVLGDTDLDGWRAAAMEERLSATTLGEAKTHGLEELGPFLAGLQAKDQIEELHRYPGGPALLHRYDSLLATPQPDDYVTIAGILDGAGEDAIRFWVEFLTHVDIVHMPPKWGALETLIAHHDDTIRSTAVRLAFLAGDSALADKLAGTWAIANAASDKEKIYGSLLISLAPSLSPEELRARVHPDVLGWLAETRPSDSANLESFANHVKASLKRLEEGHVDSPLLAEVRGWALLAEQQPQELLEWLAPFADHVTAHPMSLLHRFPFRDALGEAGKIDPELAARILKRQIEDQRGSALQVEELWNVAMRVPGKSGDDLREIVLDLANNDKKLCDIVTRAYDSSHTEWLYTAIKRDLRNSSSGIVARALTLAGFLYADEKAADLWVAIHAQPKMGWLAKVSSIAHSRFLGHAWSLHWYKLFLASDGAQAFGAHELFVATLDRRSRREPGLPPEETFREWSARKQSHWLTNAANRKSAIEKEDRERKSVLFGQKMPHEIQSPTLQ